MNLVKDSTLKIVIQQQTDLMKLFLNSPCVEQKLVAHLILSHSMQEFDYTGEDIENELGETLFAALSENKSLNS